MGRGTHERGSGDGARIALALGSLTGSAAVVMAALVHGGSWWSGGEVTVPLDGESHVVTVENPGEPHVIWTEGGSDLCGLADSRGTRLPVERVPFDEQVYVDMMVAVEPRASVVFTAPADGTVVATCEHVDAKPVMTVGIGPAPSRAFHALMNDGPLVLAAALLLLGAGILVVESARSVAALVGVRGSRR